MRIKIDRPVIVEGKYDKIKLQSVIDAHIITTDGFALFKKEEKLMLIRRLCAASGIIVLTDSDGAGKVIRRYISSALPKEKVIHLYTPQISGKEKRKNAPSKAGILGVEGIEKELLRKLFTPLAAKEGIKKGREITKVAFFEDGLSGKPDSSTLRDAIAAEYELPSKMTANALLAALNILIDYDQYKEKIKRITEKEPRP